jgi:hypothetical protein
VTRRARAGEIAQSLVGIVGDDYAAAIRAPGYERASGCGLVAGRAYLPRVLSLPERCPLVAQYVCGRAVEDIVATAAEAGAWHGTIGGRPDVGDVVVLGARGPLSAHVYVVTAADSDGDALGLLRVESVEGGVRALDGSETVRASVRWVERDRHDELVDRVEGSEHARPVLGWADVERMGTVYGWRI